MTFKSYFIVFNEKGQIRQKKISKDDEVFCDSMFRPVVMVDGKFFSLIDWELRNGMAVAKKTVEFNEKIELRTIRVDLIKNTI